MAKTLEENFNESVYKNWDEDTFRRVWTKDPSVIKEEFDLNSISKKRILILDEIHKSKKWKQKLKGFFDINHNLINIVVTGSARLNIFNKGSDSLLGRYIHFRLHPFSYGELASSKSLQPEEWKCKIFSNKKLKENTEVDQKIIKRLFNMSGFPEPYLENSTQILNIWRRSRNEKIIREDFRDLSRLPELSQDEMLASLLPEKVGSPLSVQSLREHIEVSHDTIKRWLLYLKELYYFYELKPWTKSVKRSLKKEAKIYLYDWTSVEDNGPRFENMIGSHLLKACHYWTDTGEGDFSLYYLRNKDKQEIDFLIVKDKKPWLSIESKYSDEVIDTKTIKKFQDYIKCPHVQVLFPSDKLRKIEDNLLIISANYFLKDLP